MQKRQLFTFILLCVFSACARRVTVDTYSAPQLAGQGFPAGTTFQVLENAAVPNPIFDRSVRDKLKTLLRTQGYQVVDVQDAEKAEYVMDYAYEMSGREESRVVPQSRLGHYYFTGINGRGVEFVPMYFTTYMVETYPMFVAKLRLRVLMPPSKSSLQDRALWVGEVWTESTQPDMREFINHLAAAGIRMLGKDSQKPKTLSVNDNDPLLQALKALPLPAPPAPPTS
jgi:hypothetical protein